MKRRLVDSTLDSARIVVVVLFVLFFRLQILGGSSNSSDAAWNSTEEESSLSYFEGISQNSTEFLEEREVLPDREGRNESEASLNLTSTVLTNTSVTRRTQQDNDSIGGRHGRQRIRRLQSLLESRNCTLQAVFHEIQGRPLNPPCHIQQFTVGSIIPLSKSTNWTQSYSFRLSTLNRYAAIVNASILFPVSVSSPATATGNWSSLRIGIEIQLTGSRGVAFRAVSSQRFRRKDFPENLCVQVVSTTIVRELIRNGHDVLVTNVRFSNASVFSNFDWQIRVPFVRVDATETGSCPTGFSALT